MLAAVACGDGGADESTLLASTSAAAVVCPEPVPATEVSEVVAVLADTEWDWVGPYSSGSLPPTPDLVIDGTITLESSDIPLPADCLDRADCRHQAVFRSSDLSGVAVEGGGGMFEGETRVTVTDAAVRLRLSMTDTHPGPYNYVPVVEILGSCEEPCPAGELTCPADGTCYASFDEYCRRCEDFPAGQCACRASEGPLPDGTACEVWVSGDVLDAGVCRAGVCDTG